MERISEIDRNELVSARVQRQLAEKERDGLAEKCHKTDQQVDNLKKEAEEATKQIKDLKVWEGG